MTCVDNQYINIWLSNTICNSGNPFVDNQYINIWLSNLNKAKASGELIINI